MLRNTLPLLILVGLCTFFILRKKQIYTIQDNTTFEISASEALLALSKPTPATTHSNLSTSVEINSVSPICLDASTGIIALSVTITGDPGLGTWAGNGIVNTIAGIFDPQIAGTGNHTITYTFSNPDTIIVDSIILEIIDQPEAAFILVEPICQQDTLDILFTGEAGSDAVLNWDFEGGTLVYENANILGVHWDTPGNKLVSLFIEDGHCISETFSLEVQVDTPLDTPVIECTETFSSILYEWQPIENATAYIVSVIDGPLGTIISDTSYLLSELTPGQSIGIQMVVISANSCPGSITLPVCTTVFCPEEIDAVVPFDPICIASGASDTIQLEHNIVDSLSEFNASWHGPGIIDSLLGILVVDETMLGENEVYLFLESDACSARDTLPFEVVPMPELDFQLEESTCLSEAQTITFSGTLLEGTEITWNIDNGTLLEASQNNDTLLVQWDTSGTKYVNLFLSDEYCENDTITYSTEVLSGLVPPQIICEASYSDILFSWEDLGDLADYQVIVQEGPPGNLTSDTSYLISGMTTGTVASIELTIFDPDNCVDTLITGSCSTLTCPDLNIEIEPISTICFENNDTLQLTLSPTSVIDTGALIWSGTGIIDSLNGLFSTEVNMVGQNPEVVVSYQDAESLCLFSDTINISVLAQPQSSFSVVDSLCHQDTTTITFTGNAPEDAQYNWQFHDGIPVDFNGGQGPVDLFFHTPGIHYISLSVQDSLCLSNVSEDSIFVAEPVEAPIPVCESTPESILISWATVPDAAGYQLTIDPDFEQNWIVDTAVLIEGILPNSTLNFDLTTLSPNICVDENTTFTCSTLDCPAISLDWILEPETVCLGDSAMILFNISDQQTTYDLMVSFGPDTVSINGVDDGFSYNFLPQDGELISIINIENPSNELCLPSSPDQLVIEVNTVANAGEPMDPIQVCSEVDTTILLNNLLINEDPNGNWTEVSDPPSSPGAFNPIPGTFALGNEPPGNYEFLYTVIPSAPCPIDEAIVSVQVLESPFAEAGADVTLTCNLEEVLIGSDLNPTGPNYQINWTNSNGTNIPNANLPLINVNQPGNYQILITDTFTGCTGSDEVLVEADIALLDAHLSILPVSCYGQNDGMINLDSVSGGGLPPYRVSFNGGPFVEQNHFSGLGGGNYSLTIIDANDCQTNIDIEITEPEMLEVELTTDFDNEDNTIQSGETIQLNALVNRLLSAIDTIIWSPDSIGNNSLLSNWISPTISSTYSIDVRDENGCTAFDQITVFVNNQIPVFIPNAFSPNNDGINDLFQIYAPQGIDEVIVFSVFDRWGNHVYTQKNFDPQNTYLGWDGRFNGQPLNPGVFVYLAILRKSNGDIINLKGEVSLVR